MKSISGAVDRRPGIVETHRLLVGLDQVRDVLAFALLPVALLAVECWVDAVRRQHVVHDPVPEMLAQRIDYLRVRYRVGRVEAGTVIVAEAVGAGRRQTVAG